MQTIANPSRAVFKHFQKTVVAWSLFHWTYQSHDNKDEGVVYTTHHGHTHK